MTAESTTETFQDVIRDFEGNDVAAEIAQIETVLALVEQMAGIAGEARHTDPHRLAQAYRRAPSIVRRRFRALLGEAARIAATGAEALIERRQAAAAQLLATSLRSRFDDLEATVGA